MDVYFRSALIAIVTIAAANAVAIAEVGSDAAKASGAHAGMRAYADPETGDLVVPESIEESSAAGSGAARSLPLTIVPAPTEAGGVMVDLRGQFRHATRAHVDAGGTLSAECVPGVSPP